MEETKAEDNDLNILSRPRRSCAPKEGDSITKSYKFSDDESGSEIEDKNDRKDVEFRLGGERKKVKKSRKKHKRKKSDKPKREAPSFLAVLRAQKKFDKKFEEVTDEQSSDESESEQSEEENFQDPAPKIEEAPPAPPQAKKKKFSIKPWNPGWYTIPAYKK